MPFNILVLSDYDSRIKWGLSLALRVAAPSCIDIVLRKDQECKVEQYLAGLRKKIFAVDPLKAVRGMDLKGYDMLVFAVGGGANVKVQSVLRERFQAGRKRPLLVGGFNGLTDKYDPDPILNRVGLDVVTVNCKADKVAFERTLRQVGADAPALIATGYLRLYPESALSAVPKAGLILFAQQDGVPKSPKAFSYLIDKLASFASVSPEVTVAIKLRDERRIGINRGNASYGAKTIVDGVLKRHGAKNIYVDYRHVEEIMMESSEVWSVSSTVLLEALARGKSAYCISDFGISRYLGNAPFLGGGMFVRLDELHQRHKFSPDPEWIDANAPKEIAADKLMEFLRNELEEIERKKYNFRKVCYAPSPWLTNTPSQGLRGLFDRVVGSFRNIH
ncbi:DUF6716 putative glycosyltransferase [Achromobacter kerstersii]|uniref:DUF6716 putative glycosyltransferase n=1 Tax=Achromobacter kerstersii TaxID=1353890 RepID=UPI003209DCC0